MLFRSLSTWPETRNKFPVNLRIIFSSLLTTSFDEVSRQIEVFQKGRGKKAVDLNRTFKLSGKPVSNRASAIQELIKSFKADLVLNCHGAGTRSYIGNTAIAGGYMFRGNLLNPDDMSHFIALCSSNGISIEGKNEATINPFMGYVTVSNGRIIHPGLYAQSNSGKAPDTLSNWCKANGIPTILIEDSVYNLNSDIYSKVLELAIQYPWALTKSSKKSKNQK